MRNCHPIQLDQGVLDLIFCLLGGSNKKLRLSGVANIANKVGTGLWRTQ